MKKCIFIGQAMPRQKKDLHDWPSLNNWLYSIGIKHKQIQENFYYSALVDYYPGSHNGSHRVPTKSEINEERKRLIETLRSFDPAIIVPIGKLSISHCLNERVNNLRDYIGKTYTVNPYQALKKEILVIPLPHPSGASTWCHKPVNSILLKKALKLFKINLSSN